MATKAERIRAYLQEHPDAGLAEVQKAMKGKVYSSELTTARKKLKLQGGKRPSSPVSPGVSATMPAAAQRKEPPPTGPLQLLQELDRLARQAGGLDKLERMLGILRELQD